MPIASSPQFEVAQALDGPSAPGSARKRIRCNHVRSELKTRLTPKLRDADMVLLDRSVLDARDLFWGSFRVVVDQLRLIGDERGGAKLAVFHADDQLPVGLGNLEVR